jgi:hypothetical protein
VRSRVPSRRLRARALASLVSCSAWRIGWRAMSRSRFPPAARILGFHAVDPFASEALPLALRNSRSRAASSCASRRANFGHVALFDARQSADRVPAVSSRDASPSDSPSGGVPAGGFNGGANCGCVAGL